MKLRLILSAMLSAAILAALGSAPRAQTPAGSAKDGVYTAEQATRGKALFAERCAPCHGDEATGDEKTETPALVGEKFLEGWNGKALGDLFGFMRDTMPMNEPGALTPQQYADVLAHLLTINKFPAGTAELPSNGAALSQIRFEPK